MAENENIEIYSRRLQHLVEILISLYQEAIDLYPSIKKYKRTTKLTNELNEVWNEIFTKEKQKLIPSTIKEPTTRGPFGNKKYEELVVGEYYYYTPGYKTYRGFATMFADKKVKLIKIGKISIKDMQFDSADHENSNYCVESIIDGFYYYFYTKRECLE